MLIVTIKSGSNLKVREVEVHALNKIWSDYDKISDYDLPVEASIEGKVLKRMHTLRERDRSLIEKKKRKVLKTTGRLKCEVVVLILKMYMGN